MPTPPLTDQQVLESWAIVRECMQEGFKHSASGSKGSLMQEAARRAVERGLVKSVSAFNKRIRRARERGLAMSDDEIRVVQRKVRPKKMKKVVETVEAQPRSGRVVLLTAAQDNTPVADVAWANLQAYAEHRGAEIMVGGFTYQKGLFEENRVEANVFDSKIEPFLLPEVIEIAPGLVWYGKANILPTATDPLSGWDTQTRDKWAVFPHAKIALRSVPVMPGRRPKQIMTTGVMTRANYVQRNAGQKAEFHHTIGALIVEVAPDGAFFCRQISCRTDGSFQDLDVVVSNGEVTSGHSIEAITVGDLHAEMLDREVALGTWGLELSSLSTSENMWEHYPDNIIDKLRPRYQFIHDAYDFTARSHHTRNDPHERAMRIKEGNDSVEEGVRRAADVIAAIHRPFCTTVNVASNHLFHLDRWLKDPHASEDPVNAYYWHRLNAAYHEAIRDGNEEFLVHEYAMRQAAKDGLDGVVFLREGQSFLICQTTAPIECGAHGDRGPRGARGSVPAFAKVVERMNTGHTHEPRIIEAAYCAGTSSKRDPGFAARGHGAWAPAHILTYPSGKRCIVTMDGPRWRA